MLVWSVLSQAADPVPVGEYVGWWKPIPVIVLLLWGRLVTWIDKDSQEVMLPRVPLNIGNLLAVRARRSSCSSCCPGTRSRSWSPSW